MPVCYMNNPPVTITFSWDLREPDSRDTGQAALNLTVWALIFQIMCDLILKSLQQSFSTISVKNHIVNQISTFFLSLLIQVWQTQVNFPSMGEHIPM